MVTRIKLTPENALEFAHTHVPGTTRYIYANLMRVARWVDAPKEIVEELFLEDLGPQWDFYKEVALHPKVTEEFIRKAFKVLPVDSYRVEVLMANRLFPADLLVEVFKDEQNYRESSGNLFRNPNLPPKVMLAAIVRHSERFVSHYGAQEEQDGYWLEALAGNPNLPKKVVKALLGSPYLKVHRALVKNRCLDPKLLWPLLASRNIKLLIPLSGRFDGTDREIILERISEVSGSKLARAVVASRTMDQVKMMEAVLSEDEIASGAVLRNPELSEEAKVAHQLIQGMSSH